MNGVSSTSYQRVDINSTDHILFEATIEERHDQGGKVAKKEHPGSSLKGKVTPSSPSNARRSLKTTNKNIRDEPFLNTIPSFDLSQKAAEGDIQTIMKLTSMIKATRGYKN